MNIMQTQTNWNGKTHSYRPQPGWQKRIDPAVQLHQTADDDLDPVTFEVLRQKLWTINMAHGDTITRISARRCWPRSTSTCRS